jgi:hypothetical protein
MSLSLREAQALGNSVSIVLVMHAAMQWFTAVTFDKPKSGQCRDEVKVIHGVNAINPIPTQAAFAGL